MATGTELMGSTSDDIELQAEQDRRIQAAQIQGRLTPGEKVAGYTVIGSLSFAGSEAELYRCENKGGRFVLKYYYERGRDSEIPEKLKSLRHPNVMSLIDYGTYKGYFFTILQYAAGGALNDKTQGGLFKYLPLSEEKAVEALNEILEGFNAIHCKGIIHRDIKPDNLFYNSAVRDGGGPWIGSGVLLGDFGIASLFEAEEGMTSHYTETDRATEGYEAPDAYSIEKDADSKKLIHRISPAFDYWALGVTLWVLLTGKEPFVNEKGESLSPMQIRRNASNSETANILITRAPALSEKMKQLIRGLLVKRRKERWDYGKVKDYLAGKDVEVFQEDVRDMPPFEVGDTKCYNFIQISRALLADPQEGRKIVFGGKLETYMWELVGLGTSDEAQANAEKISSLIEDYRAKGQEDEGLVAVAYELTPNLPFVVGRYKDETGQEKDAEVRNSGDIQKLLETDPDILIPVLRDVSRGFFAYLDVQGYREAGEKVRAVVNSTRSDLKLAPRLRVAFRENSIKPFQDGVNDGKELRTLDQLTQTEALPDYLKERIILFIEMKKDDVIAWIENLSGKNLDIWLDKYKNQKDKLEDWGVWRYFCLFLAGKDIQRHRAFSAGAGGKQRWGLKNNLGDEILAPVWELALTSSPPDRFIVKKNGKWGVVRGDGSEVLPLSYEFISIFDEERGLYQCKDEDGANLIIGEDQTILRKGVEPLKVAAMPGEPFDLIYDGAFFYNRETLKPLNEQGVHFEVAEAAEAHYVWMADGGGSAVLNGGGETLRKTPYSAFRASGNTALVQKGGKWGICDASGAKELIPCNYAGIQGGGNFYALIMPGGTGGILCELAEGEKKDRYWLKFEKEGGVNILPVGGGEAIASFRSALNLGTDYGEGGASSGAGFAVNGKISCLAGSELLWFDIGSGQTSKRGDVSKEEIPAILKHCSGMELYVLLTNLKKQGAYNGVHSIIDAASETSPAVNTSWATQKGGGLWVKILALIDPAHTEGLAHSYDVYLSWMGGEALRTGAYDKSHGYYSRAIALNPDNAAYHSGCGAAYYHMGDCKNAAEFFGKAAAISGGKLFTAHFLAARGSALFNIGKYKEAMATFTQAIGEAGALAPGEFYQARAACYQKLNLGDKARTDINAAVKAPKTNGEKIRGVPLPGVQASSVNIDQVASSGNSSTILKALDTLKAEGSIAAMNHLIDRAWNRFFDREDYTNALQILKRVNPAAAAGLRESADHYIFYTGECLRSLGKASEAVSYYLDAAAKKPSDDNYCRGCGSAYEALKDYTKAIKWYDKAIALNPKESFNYFSRGHCYKVMGQSAKADADFRKEKSLK